MKKLFMFLSLFMIFAELCHPSAVANAEEQKQYYAKVEASHVGLCSIPNEEAVIFEIPSSYFVKIEYAVDDFYKVSYRDFEGYVKKSKVTIMDGTPQNPYAQATFRVFAPYNIYQSPDQSSTTLCPITTADTLSYYGIKTGQQVTSSNNIWYYCKAEINGATQFGYVFSGITDNLGRIETNTESFEILDESILNDTSAEFSTLTTGTKVLLIVSISVPSVLILYFLIKPTRILQMANKKKQKKRKKIRHGDYFEFDESQL